MNRRLELLQLIQESDMFIEWFAYSLVMAGLGTAVARFSPELAESAYGVVLLAVVFCLCMGILGLSGRCYRRIMHAFLLGITLMTVALNVSTWERLDTLIVDSRLAVLNSALMVFFSGGSLVTYRKWLKVEKACE